MSKSDVDSAYQSLIVILGLMYSIMGSNSEFFWNEFTEMPSEITAMRSSVIPLLILAALLFIGMLMTNENHKIYAKLVAWATALTLAIMNITIYFIGVQLIGGGNPKMDLPIAILLFFILVPGLVFTFISPKYKEVYPDSTFFKSKTRQRLVLTYVIYIAVILGSLVLTITPYRVY